MSDTVVGKVLLAVLDVEAYEVDVCMYFSGLLVWPSY